MFTFIHKLGTSLKWTISHRPGHLMMFFHWIAVRHFQFFIALIHCLTSFLGSLYQQSSMICGDINHNFGVSKCSCHHDIRQMSEAWNEETGLTAGFRVSSFCQSFLLCLFEPMLEFGSLYILVVTCSYYSFHFVFYLKLFTNHAFSFEFRYWIGKDISEAIVAFWAHLCGCSISDNIFWVCRLCCMPFIIVYDDGECVIANI